MSKKLKPCPFCGSDQHPIVIAWEDADWVDHYGVDYGFLVVCSAATNRALETNGCGASSCWSETKKKAIAAWNTRAYQSAIDAAATGLTPGSHNAGTKGIGNDDTHSS